MIRFVALTGFLGAGKTTTLVAAARALEARGHGVAVVTNDQGTELVDTRLTRSRLDAVAEVTGGCFCCRFEDLVDVVERLVAAGGVDTVIAEAVGSCTDLQATVVRPLQTYYGDRFRVAPLTTVVDPARLRAFERAAERGEPESDLAYLFSRQLAEAEVIAVNKADTVRPEQLRDLLDRLQAARSDARVLGYSAATRSGLPELIDAWHGTSRFAVDLDVDYDRYAAAEAQLAWVNVDVDVAAAGAAFSPLAWGRRVLERLAITCESSGFLVGHAKLTVETAAGLTKLSVTGTGSTPSCDLVVDEPAESARSVVNARVACAPDALDAAIADAVAYADDATAARSVVGAGRAFRPSYPQPVHRLLVEQRALATSPGASVVGSDPTAG